MRIAANRGNRLHAPENTRFALISAYTLGANVLQFEVRLTGDGQVVLAKDNSIETLTGKVGLISMMPLAELKQLDFSKTFRPRGSVAFSYRPAGHAPVEIESFPEVLDLLPEDSEFLIELKHEGNQPDALVNGVLAALANRALQASAVLFAADPDLLRLVRHVAPAIKIAVYAPTSTPDEQLRLVNALPADGLVTTTANILNADMALTDLGHKLAKLHARGRLAVGAVVLPLGEPAVFREKQSRAFAELPFVWSLSTDSLFDVQGFVRREWTWIRESFSGSTVDTALFALGYAKANRYCHVFQDDGIHIKIAPFDGPVESPQADDPVLQQLQELQTQIWDAAKTWPFYSGGGVGLIQGIQGDFAAEVDIQSDVACQATTCEMAVVNVDPGAHHPSWHEDGTPRLPKTFRDKDVFFDPHGAPPFVGSEHDEDDGYRINWNLGTEYDTNQYGKPVGDGTSLGGRLRLERRGPYFTTYYRNQRDATDWVCTGTARNDSMNPTLYLRCAAKRWRQEMADDSTRFWPVVANEFVFRNLAVTRYLDAPR